MFETKVADVKIVFGVDDVWSKEKCQNCQSVRFLAKMEYKMVTKHYCVYISSGKRISENKVVECLEKKYAKCEYKDIKHK